MEVVAADRAVQVEHFAGEVEMRDQFALHGAGADFVQRDASGRDLRLLKSQGAGQGEPGRLERSDQPSAFGAAELGGRTRCRHACASCR